MFSANGHIGRPDGGILENYTDCLGLDPHIKSIVQPKLTKLAKSAHHFSYQDGYYCVNEDKIPVRTFHTYPLANKICVNHYYYKSQQDFFMKMARGLGTKVKTAAERKIEIFYEHLQRKGFRNDAILRFKPKMAQFARFPKAAVADIVQADSRKDLARGLVEIDAALERGQLLKAAGIHTVLCRYYSGLELDIVGANLAFLQGKQESGLAVLRRQMSRSDISADDLKQCYRALENYYALAGEPTVKAAIRQYLG